MTPEGFEPTQFALVELESTPLHPLRPLGQSVNCLEGENFFVPNIQDCFSLKFHPNDKPFFDQPAVAQ